MDTSDAQRKWQCVDSEGFTLPQKFAKISEQTEKPNQIETSNMFDALEAETATVGHINQWDHEAVAHLFKDGQCLDLFCWQPKELAARVPSQSAISSAGSMCTRPSRA